MTLYVLYTLGAVALLFGLVPLVLAARLHRHIRRYATSPRRDYAPPAVLVVPCKGLDPGFDENLSAFLRQDYPGLEVVFVTATEDDPAAAAIDRVRERFPEVGTQRLVAGIDPRRAQKINNLLAAVEQAGPKAQVLAFVDSDIRPRPDFLRELIAPLSRVEVGATTGMRWYLPGRPTLGSLLRSAWSVGGITMQADPRSSFTWGGAFALRRETFERAGVAAALDRSASDSFGVTNAIKALGLGVEFVPTCVAVSHEDSTLAETVEWTNRQTIISRVYNPGFWWMVFLTYSFSNGMLLLGLALAAAAVAVDLRFAGPALLLLALIPLQVANAAALVPALKRMLPEHASDIDRLRWRFYAVTPLASVLILLNSLVSLTTNEITWRGIRYQLVSPTETRVLGGG
jgi:cellulose synthase/poly-beta-1,6-N-acetylglucosamine synthase-like glycosyltransferase